MNVQVPLTLRPGRGQTLLWLLVCIGFVVIGISMAREGRPTGYFCAGFFGLGLPVFGLQFHPRAAYLQLSSDGFTFCSLFRAQFVPWTQVREFAVIRVGQKRMVAWNFTPNHPARVRMRRISKALSGYEAALPDTYGLKPQELAEVLNSLLCEYGKPGQ